MAILDIRRRTGYLFIAVTLGHIILISAQASVQSAVDALYPITRARI